MKIKDMLMHEEKNLFISEKDKNANLEDSLLHEEAMDMWEMANLSSKKTGLPNLIVWASGGGDKLQHGARIKVVKGTKFRRELSSTVPLFGKPRIIGNADLSQEEFTLLLKWIRLNRSAILKYYNDEISTDEFFDLIEKV